MQETYTEDQFYVDVSTWRVPYFRTGSREICSPPPYDTDADFVVLDLSHKGKFEGFSMTTEINERYGGTDFETYRRGEVNLIVVHDWSQYRAWQAATAAAKQMNLTKKRDRIDLFQGVLYGNW